MWRSPNRISSTRFCQSARELPVSLFESSSFTVAISKLSECEDWPIAAGNAPSLLGVFHHQGGTYADGSVRPLLPVEMTFDEPSSWASDDSRMGIGTIYRDKNDAESFYTLSIQVTDPGKMLFAKIKTAFEHSVISGMSFFHIECRRKSDHPVQGPIAPTFSKMVEAYNRRMAEFDEGREELPLIHFDSVAFEDKMLTKGPHWSWRWNEFPVDGSVLCDRAVAKWRRKRTL
jgi:hypothetical protein